MTTRSLRRRSGADLAIVLVQRDLRLSYGGAAFGLVWAPATVVVQVVVLTFLFDRVVPLGIDDYPAILFSGLLMWQLVSSTLNSSAAAYTDNRDLVRRPGFPDVVLPLVAVGRSIAGHLLALPLLLVVLGATGRLGVTALALPLVLGATALLLVGPAVIVAALNVRHRDVDHLVRVLVGVVFYVTPVFYAEERLPVGYGWVADLNPVAAAVSLHRQVLYEGEWPDGARLLGLVGVAALGLCVAIAVHRHAAPHLSDEL